METAFHYSVKINLFNYHNKDKVEYIEYSEDFNDNNPIKARKAAFNCYQNWLDILLEGIDKKYSSDKQAREDLKAYLIPNHDMNLTIGPNGIDFSNILSIGIGVYFVIDIPREPISENDEFNQHPGDEHLIHGIGIAIQFNDPSNFALFLYDEFLYYSDNGYDLENYAKEAKCYDWFIEEILDFKYLETPFDWSGMDNPDSYDLPLAKSQNFTDIISNGEGETVEFKPTLSYHFTKKSWEGKQEVNYKVAKAICAFLNSKGGILFIGVNDNGEIQGLDYDFKLSDRVNNRDYFKLDFDRVIDKYLGFSIKSLVNSDFIDIDNKMVFIIRISPSNNRPVFLKLPDFQKEFWIRGNASNRQLTDVEEIINYWLDHHQAMKDT